MRTKLISIYLIGFGALCVILYFAWVMPSWSSLPGPLAGPANSVQQPSSTASSTISANQYQGGQAQLPMKIITVGGIKIQVEVASTEAERQAGLSGRAGLAAGQGMLFEFSQPGDYGFWMKDMNFPIDILWADQSGTVVTIWPNLSPATYPQSFHPASPAQYVLELPANFAAQNGIAVGSKISI